MSCRRLLPVVVLSSKAALTPPLAQMPSDPLAHPSPVMSWVTMPRSSLYLLNGWLYALPNAGVNRLLIGWMSGWIGANSCLTMAVRSVA